MDAKSHFITRDALNDKLVQKLVRERGADHSILSDEDLLTSRRALILMIIAAIFGCLVMARYCGIR